MRMIDVIISYTGTNYQYVYQYNEVVFRVSGSHQEPLHKENQVDEKKQTQGA